MVKCICISKEKKVPEVGGLNNRVTFYDRDIQPPIGLDTLYGEQLTNGREFWVNIQPLKGFYVFDERNIQKQSTHDLCMRYIPDYEIDTGDWIEYKGNYYVVEKILEKYINDDYIHLEIRFLGNKEDKVNLA